MKKGHGTGVVNTKVNNRAALNTQRKALKVAKENEKEAGRKKVPRGTARAKKRRDLRALWTQNQQYEKSVGRADPAA